MILQIYKHTPLEEDTFVLPQTLLAEATSSDEYGQVFKIKIFQFGKDLLINIDNDPDRQYKISMASILRCVLFQEMLEKMTSEEREKHFECLDEKMKELRDKER